MMGKNKLAWLLSPLAAAVLLGLGTAAQAEEMMSGVNLRLEAGGGIVIGDVDADDPLLGELELKTDTGYAVGAAAWLDGLLFQHLSVGVQYLRTAQSSDEISSDLGTLTGPFEADATVNAFMANVALRRNEGTWHPYIGGGIGLAHSSADVSGVSGGQLLLNGAPVAVFTGADADDSDTGFAGQIFGGIDFDVTQNIYVGLNGRYFISNAELLGTDVDFRNIVGMGVVGFKL